MVIYKVVAYGKWSLKRVVFERERERELTVLLKSYNHLVLHSKQYHRKVLPYKLIFFLQVELWRACKLFVYVGAW